MSVGLEQRGSRKGPSFRKQLIKEQDGRCCGARPAGPGGRGASASPAGLCPPRSPEGLRTCVHLPLSGKLGFPVRALWGATACDQVSPEPPAHTCMHLHAPARRSETRGWGALSRAWRPGQVTGSLSCARLWGLGWRGPEGKGGPAARSPWPPALSRAGRDRGLWCGSPAHLVSRRVGFQGSGPPGGHRPTRAPLLLNASSRGRVTGVRGQLSAREVAVVERGPCSRARHPGREDERRLAAQGQGAGPRGRPRCRPTGEACSRRRDEPERGVQLQTSPRRRPEPRPRPRRSSGSAHTRSLVCSQLPSRGGGLPVVPKAADTEFTPACYRRGLSILTFLF